MTAKTEGIKVYPLYLGDMYSDSCNTAVGDTLATPADPHAPNRLSRTPSSAYLIKHPKAGWILFDSGMPDDPANDWPAHIADAVGVEKPAGTRMVEQLALVGVAPEDISYVINSHLHMDHIGNDNLFLDTAEFIVSRKEMEGACALVMQSTDPTKHGFYIRAEVLQDRKRVRYVEDDVEKLFDGITAYVFPGHTTGTMGLLVELEGGSLFLAEDVLYAQCNLDGALPGITWDSVGYREAIRRIRKIREEYGATVLFGHDADQFEQMKFAPDCYE